jgi:hypothetical protein
MIPGTTQMHLWLVTKLDFPAMVQLHLVMGILFRIRQEMYILPIQVVLEMKVQLVNVW